MNSLPKLHLIKKFKPISLKKKIARFIFGFEERIDYCNLFPFLLFLLAFKQSRTIIKKKYSKLTYILKLSNSNNLTRKKKTNLYRKSINPHLLYNQILNVSIFYHLTFCGDGGRHIDWFILFKTCLWIESRAVVKLDIWVWQHQWLNFLQTLFFFLF